MDIVSWLVRIIYTVVRLLNALQGIIERFLPLLNLGILLVCIATLIIALRTGRRVRRLARSSQSRADFLRDQQERLELLQTAHQLLVEKLERENKASPKVRQGEDQTSH